MGRREENQSARARYVKYYRFPTEPKGFPVEILDNAEALTHLPEIQYHIGYGR